MLKNLFLFGLTTLFSLSLWARAEEKCAVYGISDGPQTLTCTISSAVHKLTCKQGAYWLNDEPVTMAFHMDVESGPSPLIFKTAQRQLTVVIHSPSHIEAELEILGRMFTGTCR